MRTSLLFFASLLATPGASVACSCAGTQSIGNALARSDAVIVGMVTSHSEPDYSSEHPRPAIVNVEVVESLSGGVHGNIEIAKTMMCYRVLSGA